MRSIAPEALSAYLADLPTTPRIVAQGSFATPHALLRLLDEQIETYRLFMVNALPGVPDREGVRYETAFVGPGMRRHPRVDYYPCRLSLVPKLMATMLPPDIVAIQVSRPIGGRVSLGIEVQIIPGALAAARARGALVIAQVNRNMPFVHGDGVMDLDLIDVLVEIDEPLPTDTDAEPDDLAMQIGAHVADLVPHGAALQAGIGAVPDAVLRRLVDHNGLLVWTELLTEGFRQLHLAGALDERFPVTGSFAYGPQEFYDWIDDNPQVQLLGCEYTNDPGIIASQPQMTSINTALQVDLFGAANASRIRDRIFSGTGGQTDFIVGALHAEGGTAILALKAWHPKADVSTIVDKLSDAATSMQAGFFVTEHGSAQVFGRSQREQALGIASIADLRAREHLVARAGEMGLLS